jgi:intraflagellar transport protein 88
MYEQAIEYFERASAVQPNEVKWRLMVTSCYRRLGDLNRALELYQQIHEDHPENIESLQYLEALCKDLERPYEEYSRKLEKLRRSQPVQQPTNAGATRVGNAPVAQQAPQRTERPKPERSDRPSAQSQSKPADEPSTAAVSKSPLAAPRSGVQANARAPSSKSAKGTDDDDDFFDTDVTSLLG